MPFCRPCVALGEAGMDGWTCQVELLKAIREQRQQMDLKDEQLEASASMQYKLALAKFMGVDLAQDQKRKLDHFQEELARCLPPEEARQNCRFSVDCMGMMILGMHRPGYDS